MIISDFFSEVDSKYNPLPSPNDEMLIKNNSMVVISKLCEKFKNISNSMESEIEPQTEVLQWFLYFELLMFLIYKFENLKSDFYYDTVYLICKRSFRELNRLLLRKTYETRVFLIDLVWQNLFYESIRIASNQNMPTAFFFDGTASLKKIIDNDSNIDLIKTILHSNKMYNIFKKYTGSSSKKQYEKKINKILNKVFIFALQKNHHGITLINNIIVIDSSLPFPEVALNAAYRLIILIHEIGHLLARKNCVSAQSFLEYSSAESPSTELSPMHENPQQKPESGDHIEKKLFGYRVKMLHTEGARYIMTAENWDLDDFAEKFKATNKLSQEDLENHFNGVRMRGDSDKTFVDLSNNWCLVSCYR